MLVNVWVFYADRGRTPALLLPARLVRDGVGGGGCSLGRRFRFDQRRQGQLKRLSRLRQDHTILWTLRPGQRWLDRREIERQQLRVLRFRSLLVMEQALLAAVSLDQRNLFVAAPGKPKVLQRLFINREDPASRPILRRHISNGGAIGERQIPQPRSEVLNELSNDAMLAQHL